MRRTTATVTLLGVLALGGVTACSEQEQDQVEQQVEDGADKAKKGAEDAGDEVEQQVGEGAEDSGEG